MKIQNILKTKASPELEQEVEKELKEEDPSIKSARAILHATKNYKDNSQDSQKDSS